ncbi:MAG: T9SS type A sorting domain-containing protein [bacterium]|nr:T9SS type A sorting domain-containing protein [bacterium]
MKHLPLLLIAMLLLAVPVLAAEQVTLGSSADDYSVDVLRSDINTTVVQMELNRFAIDEVMIEGASWSTIGVEGKPLWKERGLPALPTLRQSILIPDNAQMSVRILDSDYRDFPNMDIAPSKGGISRSIDPATVSYEFAEFYNGDSWFPRRVCDLGEPYIMRDNRGLVLEFNPFRYNPATRTLRVYTSIEVEVTAVGPGKVNVLTTRPAHRVDEFEKMYDTHFINNVSTRDRYTTIPEVGNMLVITYDAFRSAVEPFVAWKNQMGVPTTLVNVTDIGSSGTQIKSYIQNMYDTDGVTFVLLVGDAAQVPYYNNGGASDPSYGLLAGTDNYPEAFIGRMSAENLTQVETQVERSIAYERDATAAAWYAKGMGIASDDGNGGDDDELDWEHLDNIRTDLLNFTYTDVAQVYEPSGTLLQAVSAVEEGLSIINYCGHGSISKWVTTNFTIDDVNSLTNDNMLPFVVSVACNNGEFQSGTCFGESWLRATNNGAPTGAVGFYGSTISQDWDPPMSAQDEINYLLVNNAKRTYGALCYNGSCKMMDDYTSQGPVEFKMWTIFGDPSLRVRTASPMTMTVGHIPEINPFFETYLVETDPGALAAISYDGDLMGSAFADAGGTATIAITGDMPMPGAIVKLTVSNFNKVTYVADLMVSNGLEPTCDINPRQFNLVMLPDQVFTDQLYIANNGEEGSTLYYSIDVTDPDFPNGAGHNTPRNITGSTLVIDVEEYLPGTTLDVLFTASCVSNDSEWIKEVLFDLPTGVICNSATAMTGPHDPMAYNGATGNGADGAWLGPDQYGEIYPGESASATVNMTFAAISGDVVIPYTIQGDIYGSEPHSLSGELVITMAGPNVTLTSLNSGELLAVDDVVAIDYIAAGGPASVKIELTRDGLAWETLATGLPAGAQSYSWTVTAPISATCRVKVTDEGDPGVTDSSDNLFTIYRPLTWVSVGEHSGAVNEGDTESIPITFDATGLPDGTYRAEVLVTNSTGTPVMVPVQIIVSNSGTSVEETPAALNLAQNHPNPFNPTTAIDFALTTPGNVKLTVFDVQGRIVKSLVDGHLTPGNHQIVWDGRDDQDQPLASGMYFYRLDIDSGSLTRKMMLLK